MIYMRSFSLRIHEFSNTDICVYGCYNIRQCFVHSLRQTALYSLLWLSKCSRVLSFQIEQYVTVCKFNACSLHLFYGTLKQLSKFYVTLKKCFFLISTRKAVLISTLRFFHLSYILIRINIGILEKYMHVLSVKFTR